MSREANPTPPQGGVEALVERLTRDLELQDGGGAAYAASDEVYTVVVQGEDLRGALAALRAQQAEITRLEGERDEALGNAEYWRSAAAFVTERAQSAEAELERVKAERDEFREQAAEHARYIEWSEQESARQAARLAEAKAVIEPFAAIVRDAGPMADRYSHFSADAEHFRKAAALLSRLNEQGGAR